MFLAISSFLATFLISVCLCAVRRPVPATDSRLSPNLNNLPSELVTNVGSYLKCPHKELSLVCKNLNDVYTQDFPFNMEVARRFDIPELFNAKSFKDLGFFLNFGFIPDKLTKFHLLMNHMFYHENSFKENSKYLAWHLYKIYKEIPLEYKKTTSILYEFMPSLVSFLIKHEAFDMLIEIMTNDPQEFIKGIDKFQFQDAINFFKALKESSSSSSGEDYEKISNVLIEMFQVLEASNNKIFFNALFICTPLEFYKRAAYTNISYLKDCFLNFLLEFQVRFDFHETCYLKVQKFIEEFVETDKKMFFGWLNAIRFKPEIDLNFDLDLIFDDFDAFCLFITVSTSCRINLIHEILSNHKSFMIEMFKTYEAKVTVKALWDLLPYLSNEERDDLLSFSDNRFTKLLLSKMAISRIEYLPDLDVNLLELKVSQDLMYSGVREYLEIRTRLSEWYLINNYTVVDKRTLYKFLESFTELPSHVTLFENEDREEISPNLETIKMILSMPTLCRDIDSLEYCFSIYLRNDHDLVEVLKMPTAYNLEEFYSSEPYNMNYLLSKGNGKNYFDRLESHFRHFNGGNLVGFINGLTTWNYGEIRHVLFYLLRDEKRKQELLNLSDPRILQLLAYEVPEEVASLYYS